MSADLSKIISTTSLHRLSKKKKKHWKPKIIKGTKIQESPKMVVAAGVGEDRSTDTGIARHLNTLNAMNMRNIASDAALSDVIRDYFVQINLRDSELS